MKMYDIYRHEIAKEIENVEQEKEQRRTIEKANNELNMNNQVNNFYYYKNCELKEENQRLKEENRKLKEQIEQLHKKIKAYINQ